MKHPSKNKTFLIITLALVLSGVSYESIASSDIYKEKTFIEKYLYWLVPQKQPEGPTPTETLQAPFSSTNNDEKNTEIGRIYEEARQLEQGNNIRNLNVPHRSHEQVEDWIADAVGKSLNFQLSDMKRFGRIVEPYYSENGISTYKRFLMGMNAIAIMQTNSKKVSSYITTLPTLKKEGNREGIYHWIYDVPVQVSYLDNSTPPRETTPINQDYMLRLKIMRTDNLKKHTEGLYIDLLSAKKISNN